jgi:lipoprotein-releasing system permease protein
LQFWLKNPDDSNHYKRLIEEAGYSSVQTWQERNASIFFALKLEKFMIGIFLTMAVLVAAFSLLMSLALLASQKRKDFILLRLLGFSPRDLQSLYMSLSLGLGSIGLIAGAVIGAIISLYLEWFPLNILPDIYHDSDISAKLDLGVTFGLLAGGFLVLALVSLSLVKLLPTKNIAAALKNS